MGYVNQEIEKQITTDVDALKYKEIQSYYKYINYLQKCGISNKYQYILELISLIDIYSTLDEKKFYYKQFYLNNEEN